MILTKEITAPKLFDLSSLETSNDLQHIRKELRRNFFFHLDFKPWMETEQKKKFFEGIYIPNSPEYEKLEEEENNFLEFVIK